MHKPERINRRAIGLPFAVVFDNVDPGASNARSMSSGWSHFAASVVGVT
jgi:hypothetical protein